jgi:hypothetical protein
VPAVCLHRRPGMAAGGPAPFLGPGPEPGGRGGSGPVLRRGVLAGLAVASSGYLVQVIGQGLQEIRYRPRLVGGCRTGTGRSLELGLSGHHENFKGLQLGEPVPGGGLAAGPEYVNGQHRGGLVGPDTAGDHCCAGPGGGVMAGAEDGGGGVAGPVVADLGEQGRVGAGGRRAGEALPLIVPGSPACRMVSAALAMVPGRGCRARSGRAGPVSVSEPAAAVGGARSARNRWPGTGWQAGWPVRTYPGTAGRVCALWLPVPAGAGNPPGTAGRRRPGCRGTGRGCPGRRRTELPGSRAGHAGCPGSRWRLRPGR